MNARQVASRAWEMRPTWRENAVLTVLGLATLWFYGWPWWLPILIYVLMIPVSAVLFAWLELSNETAEDDEGGEL